MATPAGAGATPAATISAPTATAAVATDSTTRCCSSRHASKVASDAPNRCARARMRPRSACDLRVSCLQRCGQATVTAPAPRHHRCIHWERTCDAAVARSRNLLVRSSSDKLTADVVRILRRLLAAAPQDNRRPLHLPLIVDTGSSSVAEASAAAAGDAIVGTVGTLASCKLWNFGKWSHF